MISRAWEIGWINWNHWQKEKKNLQNLKRISGVTKFFFWFWSDRIKISLPWFGKPCLKFTNNCWFFFFRSRSRPCLGRFSWNFKRRRNNFNVHFLKDFKLDHYPLLISLDKTIFIIENSYRISTQNAVNSYLNLRCFVSNRKITKVQEALFLVSF